MNVKIKSVLEIGLQVGRTIETYADNIWYNKKEYV